MWIKFLTGMSDMSRVRSGVPKWSVLGPLLFIIFINGIDDKISGTILKFADDINVLGKVWTGQATDKLKTDLKGLYGWPLDW